MLRCLSGITVHFVSLLSDDHEVHNAGVEQLDERIEGCEDLGGWTDTGR